jgi:hypothetical protein
MPEQTGAYVGWQRRPGQRWRKVVDGDDADDILRQLLASPREGRGRDVVVLPRGADLNEASRGGAREKR